jgi:hypothetical protein
VFSCSKQIATDRRATLGSVVFEELVIMSSAWGPGLYDKAAWNAFQVEEIPLFDYEEMLVEDDDCEVWDNLDMDDPTDAL